MRRYTTTLLVSLNVVFLCLLSWLWIDPHGGMHAIHWQPSKEIKPELGSFASAPIEREDADVARFMVILDRPLFSPTRRPTLQPKSEAPPRFDPLEGIHLYGLFMGSGGGGVIARVEGKTRRVKLSESIGDWSLKEIRSRDAVFARGTESRVVPLMQAGQAQHAALAQPSTPIYSPPASAALNSVPVEQALPAQSTKAEANASAVPKRSSPFVVGAGR